MTDPAVSTGHPPELLMSVLNRTLRVLLPTPLAGPLGKQFMLLKFTGRKTGRQFTIPVTAHHIDAGLYALANAGWKNNFRGGHDVTVVHAGRTTPMRGQLISDPATVADLARRLAQSYGPKRAQTMMGLKFRDDASVPSLQEFRDAAHRDKLVAIQFTPVTQ
ncbi:hypothetical protein [Mycolicibacterium phlei]